jgi:hypothetical protein
MLSQDMRKDINRQVYGDGTGVLTTIAPGPDDHGRVWRPRSTSRSTTRSTSARPTAPCAARRLILTVNRTTKTITWDTTITTPVATDLVTIQGNYGRRWTACRT